MARPSVRGPIVLGKNADKKGFMVLFRRSTTEEWATVNPVLALGEPGVDTDTVMMKIGDGVSHWEDLDWCSQEQMLRVMFGKKIKE